MSGGGEGTLAKNIKLSYILRTSEMRERERERDDDSFLVFGQHQSSAIQTHTLSLSPLKEYRYPFLDRKMYRIVAIVLLTTIFM